MEKIKKLENKIKIWSNRHLTMEGKNLIIKTFGLSQLIYNMQSYGFEKTELISTEKKIFNFLWSTKDNPNGIDRIKRSVMKNDFINGGMKVTDVECLDRSLKLKQFIRASTANHAISKIQNMITLHSSLQQEYFKITEEEPICKTAQETINIITDGNRKEYTERTQDQFETDKNLIEEVASINIKTFLKRKKKEFHLCMLTELTKMDIITLGDLTQALEYENDRKKTKLMEMILGVFPAILQKIAKCYNDELNTNLLEIKTMKMDDDKRLDIRTISVKEFQKVLKKRMKKVEVQDFDIRLGINNFDNKNIPKFRRTCQNSKLRNIYFRLINNDFFTRERMTKYKMIQDDTCPRCNNIETTKHLLFECNQVAKIWKLFNTLMSDVNQGENKVEHYDDVYKSCVNPASSLIKIKVIQSLIQIQRPSNWTRNNLLDILKEIKNIEKYNSLKNRTLEKFERKWNPFKDIT
jgi:hypothetical protein